MSNFLSKFFPFIKKPPMIVVAGQSRKTAREAFFQVLKQCPAVKRKPLLYDAPLDSPEDLEKFKCLTKKSDLAILVVTNVGEIPFDKDFFAGEAEKTKEITELAENLPAFSYLILNFDDETVREIADVTNLKTLTFGFQEEADFKVSDVKLNHGTNFKINYKGNIVPVWLESAFGKEQIYSALAAACVGTILDLNLVEISQALKNYQPLPGKMRLIRGIKNSWILDDSESATVPTMMEAIDILGKTQGFGRKIAVLGDIVGIGKYTVEAHETIGEKVAKSVDLLFAIGQKASFFAEGARNKGMAVDKIFQFDNILEANPKLKEGIKENDLILIDGSKEMEMGKIVEELRAEK